MPDHTPDFEAAYMSAFPKTLDELRAAGYRFDGHSHCAGCNAIIEWWWTPAGKRMPMDVTDSGKAVAHWASCPNADRFRKVRV